MKAQTLRNAIEAHGWVGVILSLPLFVVFWAGALTLFFPEVSLWSSVPVITADPSPTTPPTLRGLIDQKLAELPPLGEHPLYVFLPSERSPLLQLYISLKGPEGSSSKSSIHLVIDPSNGATVSEGEPFELARFLYDLHFTLQLPHGDVIVGVVSLFFLVLLMTGIVVQLKNLVADFFLYRHARGARQRVHDIHTVAGVLTLPFATLYALTGLIFNLSILFQLPLLMLVYRGDEAAAMVDAGYARFAEKPVTGIAVDMPELEPLIARIERDGAQVTSLSWVHYRDQSSRLEFEATAHAGFPERLTPAYDVASSTFVDPLPMSAGRATSTAVDMLLKLHLTKFGGRGVRVLFYLLALGVCGMIVAGNLLWLAKREAKLAKYPRSFAAVRGVTLGACVGVVVATGVCFATERFLPAGFAHRKELVRSVFVVVLSGTTLAGFCTRRVRPFLRTACWVTAAVLVGPALVDLLRYSAQLGALWNRGYPGPAGVSLAFLVHAALFAWLATLMQSEVAHQPPVVSAQGS